MTLIITASVAVVCAFAFGFAVGHQVGKADNYASPEVKAKIEIVEDLR